MINKVNNPFNGDIYIGKELDKSNTKVRISNFEIDKIDHKNKFIIESKKSNSNKEISKFQLLFYLFLTKNIYKNYRGKLIFIENNSEEIIELDIENEKDLIIKLNKLNFFYKKPYFDINLLNQNKCQKCSFFELCHC